MEPVPTPHDRFFRESFGRPEIARDFLRHYLPPEVLGQVDLDTLSVSKDTYVSKELRAAYSDLVCSAGYRGGELRVYLLFEHKSRPEFRTVLQLLRYVVAEGERYFKERPKARRLPPVYSLVLYPAHSSHRALTSQERAQIGIGDGLVRLSVGIEAPADILNDIKQALKVIS